MYEGAHIRNRLESSSNSRSNWPRCKLTVRSLSRLQVNAKWNWFIGAIDWSLESIGPSRIRRRLAADQTRAHGRDEPRLAVDHLHAELAVLGTRKRLNARRVIHRIAPFVGGAQLLGGWGALPFSIRMLGRTSYVSHRLKALASGALEPSTAE